MIKRNRFVAILGVASCLLPTLVNAQTQKDNHYNLSELMSLYQSQSRIVEKMNLLNDQQKESLENASKQYDFMDGSISVRLAMRDNLDKSIKLAHDDKKKADQMTIMNRAYQDYYYKSAIKQSISGYLNFAIMDYQFKDFDNKVKHEERKAENTFEELLVEYQYNKMLDTYLAEKKTYTNAFLEEVRLKEEKGLISKDELYNQEMKLLALTLDENKVKNKIDSLYKEIITTLHLSDESVLDIHKEMSEVMKPIDNSSLVNIALKTNKDLDLLEFQLDVLDIVDQMASEAFREEDLNYRLLKLKNEKKRLELSGNIDNLKVAIRRGQKAFELASDKFTLDQQQFKLKEKSYQLSVKSFQLNQISESELEKSKLNFLKSKVDFFQAYSAYLKAFHSYENLLYGSM